MSRRQNRSSPRLHRQRPHVFRACGTVLLLVLFAGIGALWGNTLDNAVVANTPDVASAPAPQETAAAEEASAPLQASAAPGTVCVWVPKSGARYHQTSDCSGMQNPAQVTLEEALAQGYTPCQRCQPPDEAAQASE